MTEGWHVGRKAIIDFFYAAGFLRSNKITAWRTIVRWKKVGAIILHHDTFSRPFVIESEIKKQKLRQAEIAKKRLMPSH